MDRIIEVKVGGNYLCKDNKNAGVRGEANVTNLRITFDESWDGYAKTITFWDARGTNSVKRILTTDYLENIEKNTRVYLVPIPGEPMTEAGNMTFVIDGYIDGKRQRSMEDKLVVKDAPIDDNAVEPADPMPTQAEQLQTQVDMILGDIQKACNAGDEAKAAEHNAKYFANEAKSNAEVANLARETAVEAIGKTSYIGDNGNWYAWDGYTSAFYDTGVKAQAGSTVYLGDNPPDDADVWINPDGESLDYITRDELKEELEDLGQNKVIEEKISKMLQCFSRCGAEFTFNDKTFILTDVTTEYNGKKYYGVFYNANKLPGNWDAGYPIFTVTGNRTAGGVYATFQYNWTDIQTYNSYFSPFSGYLIGDDYEWFMGSIRRNKGDTVLTPFYFKGSVGVPSVKEFEQILNIDSISCIIPKLITRDIGIVGSSVAQDHNYYIRYDYSTKANVYATLTRNNNQFVGWIQNSSGVLTLMTYISEDFFKTVHLNPYTMGAYAKWLVSTGFTREDLSATYNNGELDMIFGK